MRKILESILALRCPSGVQMFRNRKREIKGQNNMIQYKVFYRRYAAMEETFPLPAWSVEAHLQVMEEAGISPIGY